MQNGNGHLQVTSGKVWREQQRRGIVITLPSGMVAEIRPVGFDLLLRSEFIPDFLTKVVVDGANGKPAALPELETVEDTRKKMAFLDDLCRLAYVNPRVVDTPTADDEIAASDIPLADKYGVWQLTGATPSWLETFRFPQAADLAALVHESGFTPEAESVGEAADAITS